jgi:crossover junction endodeoxyribonuclease RuvC
MLILGLDLSTLTGFSVVTDRDGHVEILKAVEVKAPLKKGQTEVGRWTAYMEKLAAQLEIVQETYGKIDHCFIEGYAFSPHQGKDNIVTQCAIGTCARMIVAEYDIPYYQISPGNWKKFLSGNGALKKDQVMMALFKHFGFEAETDNIADATAIALFGLSASATISGPAYRKEAVDAWRKSKFGHDF